MQSSGSPDAMAVSMKHENVHADIRLYYHDPADPTGCSALLLVFHSNESRGKNASETCRGDDVMGLCPADPA